MTFSNNPTTTLPAGLAVVYSNRPENLRSVVVEHLRKFPLAPLEEEVVLVQSFGIGRWLQLAMAETAGGEGLGGGLGISASVRFELPAQFIWSAYRTVLNDQELPEQFESYQFYRPDCLLFLDEADSLVADRTGASQRWEVSQVNELLKGLEGFSGLFVASTNLMDRLDPAVMRRLDFKVHFGWLKPDQRWRLFLDLARHAGVSVRGLLARKLRRQLDAMHCLTPGDFALLARRLAIRPVTDGQELLELLERETRHKPEVRSQGGIGFTARLDR